MEAFGYWLSPSATGEWRYRLVACSSVERPEDEIVHLWLVFCSILVAPPPPVNSRFSLAISTNNCWRFCKPGRMLIAERLDYSLTTTGNLEDSNHWQDPRSAGGNSPSKYAWVYTSIPHSLERMNVRIPSVTLNFEWILYRLGFRPCSFLTGLPASRL